MVDTECKERIEVSVSEGIESENSLYKLSDRSREVRNFIAGRSTNRNKICEFIMNKIDVLCSC